LEDRKQGNKEENQSKQGRDIGVGRVEKEEYVPDLEEMRQRLHLESKTDTEQQASKE